jgi:hypothetical protein
VTHYSRAAFGDLISVMRSGQVDFVQAPYNAAETAVTEKLYRSRRSWVSA